MLFLIPSAQNCPSNSPMKQLDLSKLGFSLFSHGRYLAGENSSLPDTDTKLTYCRLNYIFYPCDFLSVLLFFSDCSQGYSASFQ